MMVILAVLVALGAIAMLVIQAFGDNPSRRLTQRLAALDHEFTPADYEEKVADIRREQKNASAIPLLNEWLRRLNLTSSTVMFFYQAGSSQTVGSLLTIGVVGWVVLGVLLWFRFDEFLPALIISMGFLPLPFLYIARKRSKRMMTLEQQLPEAIGMMVSALRVGHSLIASIGAVAQESAEPIATEMRKCFDEQNYGIDLRIALTNLTERVPLQDYRIFVAAVLIQKESGGNLAEVLEKVAQTTRDRFRLRKQIRVHTAQGRMTGWILSFLPVVLGFGMYLVNPDGMSILWKRDVGLKLLYTAGVMDVIGAMIIRKIVSVRV